MAESVRMVVETGSRSVRTRVETMLEHAPTQQDIGDIRASIEAVKSLIAEKQTSALRWSIVTLAGAVAALAGLIVAFRP